MSVMPATEAARAIREGTLSPLELLEECLRTVDRLNPVLNAVVWRDDERARTDARTWEERVQRARRDGEVAGLPPFAGVPIPIKDLTDVEGQVTTWGSNGTPAVPAEQDAMVVAALRAAGFVICARTNTPELGLLPVTENARYGVTKNPWNPELTSGGSSGGAAAAVASGMFAVAHGTDGGGSIRIPSSCCGLVGLKPSRGRIPEGSVVGLGLSYPGVLTRTVDDLAAILDSLSRDDPFGWPCAPAPEQPFGTAVGKQPPALKVAIVKKAVTGTSTGPNQLAALEEVARALAEMGHDIEEVELPSLAQELVAPWMEVFFGGAIFARLPQGFDPTKMDAHVRVRHEEAGEPYKVLTVLKAFSQMQKVSRALVAEMAAVADLYVTPTMACDPPLAGSTLRQLHDDPRALPADVMAMGAFTPLANATGQPALSIPTAWSAEGVPIGVMLTGGPYSETLLIQVAAALQEATSWPARWPDIARS